MNRKFIIRLLLLAVTSILLYSCMNEDLYSSSEKEKQEIQSKSLWKEDMVFITNVKEIFLKNASLENFKTNHGGLPQWEYAMTFGNFDESYLMVPVFGENKVTGVVTVKRIEDMVYFKFSKDEKAKSFFSHLISPENKKLTPVKEIAENAKIICTSRTYNLCFPNNDGTQDCYSQMVVKCISEDGFEDNDIGGDNSDNGLPYGGGGNGNSNPQQNQNPCAKLKTQNADVNYKAKTDFLKTKTGDSFEHGFRVNKPVSGQTGTQYQQMSGTIGSNTINFKYFNNTNGYMHSHFDGLIPMFSPDDINLFIGLLINANNNGIPLSEVFISVVNPDGTVYQLRGDGIDVASLSLYSKDMIDNVLNTEYKEKYYMESSNKDPEFYQENFLKFMKEKMNITGAKLYSINSEGKSKEVYIQNGTRQTSDCPQ